MFVLSRCRRRGPRLRGERPCPDGAQDGKQTGAPQPVVKGRLHSAGAATRGAALLLPHILPVGSVVASCPAGASPASVRRRTFTKGCQVMRADKTRANSSHLFSLER